jgi:hypothetical protein
VGRKRERKESLGLGKGGKKEQGRKGQREKEG